MKLVKNWRKLWKTYSTQALTLAAGIPGAWLMVPDEIKVLIPAQAMATITAVVAAAGLAGRFIDQRKPHERELDGVVEQVKAIAKEKGLDAARTAIRKELGE